MAPHNLDKDWAMVEETKARLCLLNKEAEVLQVCLTYLNYPKLFIFSLLKA